MIILRQKQYSLGKSIAGYGTGYVVGGLAGDAIGGKIGSKINQSITHFTNNIYKAGRA